MIPTASPSSSSTLSPLAPPFTVDRPSTAHRFQPYCYPPPPLAGEFNGKESSPVKSVGESSSWMDPSPPYPHSPFGGGGAAESFVGYGDAYGAWHGKHVDSSARPHIGADSLAWQGESPTVYEEKARDSCNNGLSYFQLPNPNLVMNECDTSNSNSSYSRYMSQLVSGSTDPIVCYPVSTCSSSAEVSAPANETGSSMYFTPRNCYSTPHHGNLLYNVDDNYVDYMLGNKKETNISPYSDGKDGYVNGGAAEKVKENNGAGNSSITTTWSSLGNKVTTRNSMDYSAEVKYGFGTKKLNFNESIASSSMPNSSLQTSSDILDQPHLVDSPCWRGASVSQQYLLGSAEIIGLPHNEVQESKAYDDLHQGQNYLPVSDQYLRISPCQEKDGSPVCNVIKGSSPFSGDFSPNISLYGMDKRFPHINAKVSEGAEVGEDKSSHFSCIISVKRNEVKDSEKYSDQVKRNVKQSGEMSSAVLPANSLSLVGEGANIKAGLTDATRDNSFDPNLYADNHVSKFSVPGVLTSQVAKPTDSTDPTGNCITRKETRLLLKALHSLSEMLLSSFYDGGVELEECDNDLVQLVIDNLETFTCSKKGMKRSSHAPENVRGQSQVSVPKSNDTVKKQSSTSTKDAEGKFCRSRSCMNSDKFDIRRPNGVTQILVKDLENDVFAKKEDDPQAVLYKNLWMQAEAALCSMKYELQVARMRLEIENCECQMKEKEPVQVKKSPMLNFMPSFDAPAFATQESLCEDASCYASCYAPAEEDACKSSKEKQKEQKTNKNDKIDSSVMARLEVLKGRYVRSNNISIEEQPKCSDTENTLKDLPMRLADLGFVESGIPQPFDEDGNRDSPSSTFEQMPADIPHLALAFNEQNKAFCVEISEDAVVHTSDVPLYQPFMPSMGNQINPMRFILG